MDERAQAWLHGYRSGLCSQWSAVHYVQEASRLMELCRMTPAERRVLWQQAMDDALEEYPELPAVLLRALGARRITAIIVERLREQLDAVPQAQAAE
jgi:hypothetical protein